MRYGESFFPVKSQHMGFRHICIEPCFSLRERKRVEWDEKTWRGNNGNGTRGGNHTSPYFIPSSCPNFLANNGITQQSTTQNVELGKALLSKITSLGSVFCKFETELSQNANVAEVDILICMWRIPVNRIPLSFLHMVRFLWCCDDHNLDGEGLGVKVFLVVAANRI